MARRAWSGAKEARRRCVVRGGQRCGERCGHEASCGRGEGPRNGTGKGEGGAHGTVTLGPGTSTLRVHTDASLSCYVEGNAFPAPGHPLVGARAAHSPSPSRWSRKSF